MRSGTPRIFGVLVLLVGVWIVAYWAYEPRSGPRVTRDERRFADGPASQSPTSASLANQPLVETRAAPLDRRSNPGESVQMQASPQAQPGVQASIGGQSNVAQQVETRERVIAPRFREIKVQKGDTSWERIAARELGDRKLWEAVSRANPYVTSDRLIPGKTVLRIPLDPTNIQGKLVEVQVPVATGTNAGSPSAAGNGVATQGGAFKTYTITADDTLWSIARTFYDKGSSWRVIYEANKDVIRDPDRPPVGKTIRIPPAPTN